MYKGIISVILLSIICAATRAQDAGNATVRGRVVEESSKEGIPFANAALCRAADSSLVSGAITGNQGNFMLEGIGVGTYLVKVSFIGYDAAWSSPLEVKEDHQKIDLGTLAIRQSAKVLEATEITAERSTFEMAIDRKVYHVGTDLQGQNGTATEVLENVPSVTVGAEGDVSLRGSSNITYFINGRPSALMRSNPTAALQQISASSIERIEIITNPSAKYRPDGAAGIINIVLKKETGDGINGTFMANGGNNGRYNTNLTVGMHRGKVNAYASYGLRVDNRLRSTIDNRTYKDSLGMPESYYEEVRSGSYTYLSHAFNSGLDIKAGENTDISFSGAGQFRNMDRPQEFTIVTRDALRNLTLDFTTQQEGYEKEMEVEGGIALEHRFKKEDHTISVEGNAAIDNEMEESEYEETYRFPDQGKQFRSLLIENSAKQGEFVIDYANPLGEDVEWEAGYEYTLNTDDRRYGGEHLDTAAGLWVKDADKNNRFKVSQTLHAVYSTLGFPLGDLNVMLGVRGEQSLIRGYLVTLDSTVDNNYFKVYPTLHLSYELDDNMEMQLNYSRRVNRPDGDEMNPFPEYSDPRNMEAGNPKLKPEQTHSVETGFQRSGDKTTFISSLFYRYTFDAFSELTERVNDSLLLTTFGNLSSEQSAGLEIMIQGKLKKWLSMNGNATLFYNEIDASNLGYEKNRSNLSWYARFNSNIYLPANTMLQLTSYYRSGRLTPQGKSLPFFVMNAGVKKDLFERKASVVITVSDVFNTLRWKNEVHTKDMDQVANYNRKSQIIYLGFTWRFGKELRKGKDDLKFDEGM